MQPKITPLMRNAARSYLNAYRRSKDARRELDEAFAHLIEVTSTHVHWEDVIEAVQWEQREAPTKEADHVD